MVKRDNNKNPMPPATQPGRFCFAILGLALTGLFLLIVRLGEEPTSRQAVIALLLVCAPFLCLRTRRA